MTNKGRVRPQRQIIVATEKQVVNQVHTTCPDLRICDPLTREFGMAIFSVPWPRLRVLILAHPTPGMFRISSSNFPALVRCEIGGRPVSFSTPSTIGHYPYLRGVIESNRRRNEKMVELFLCLVYNHVDKNVARLICEAVPHEPVPLPPDPCREVLSEFENFENLRRATVGNYKFRKSSYPTKESRMALKMLYKAKLKSLAAAEHAFREEVNAKLQNVRSLRPPPKRHVIRLK